MGKIKFGMWIPVVNIYKKIVIKIVKVIRRIIFFL